MVFADHSTRSLRAERGLIRGGTFGSGGLVSHTIAVASATKGFAPPRACEGALDAIAGQFA
jgi:hypothetical protein